MGTELCPWCGKASVFEGGLTSSGGPRALFLPHRCDMMAVSVAFRACVSCGLVWTAVDPGGLRDVIAKHGRALARQHLDEIDFGPYRGLPDTALAREVAEKVAEVDALVRSGKTGAAGRYRELAGVTWDAALRDVGRWPRLTCEEKLELFGWASKKKAIVDDLDSPFP
jgi:hypothetical protein